MPNNVEANRHIPSHDHVPTYYRRNFFIFRIPSHTFTICFCTPISLLGILTNFVQLIIKKPIAAFLIMITVQGY